MHDFIYDKDDIENARQMMDFVRFSKCDRESVPEFEQRFRPFLNSLVKRFKQHGDAEMKIFYLIMLGALGNEPKDSSWIKRLKVE